MTLFVRTNYVPPDGASPAATAVVGSNMLIVGRNGSAMHGVVYNPLYDSLSAYHLPGVSVGSDPRNGVRHGTDAYFGFIDSTNTVCLLGFRATGEYDVISSPYVVPGIDTWTAINGNTIVLGMPRFGIAALLIMYNVVTDTWSHVTVTGIPWFSVFSTGQPYAYFGMLYFANSSGFYRINISTGVGSSIPDFGPGTTPHPISGSQVTRVGTSIYWSPNSTVGPWSCVNMTGPFVYNHGLSFSPLYHNTSVVIAPDAGVYWGGGNYFLRSAYTGSPVYGKITMVTPPVNTTAAVATPHRVAWAVK